MITNPIPALTHVVGLLRAAGFEADTNPANVNPGAVTDAETPTITPAAWVKWPGTVGTVFLDGSEFVPVEVYLLAPDLPYPDALAALFDVAALAYDVLGEPDAPVRNQSSKFGDARENPTLVLPYLVENPPAE